jgi:hypothetical protein
MINGDDRETRRNAARLLRIEAFEQRFSPEIADALVRVSVMLDSEKSMDEILFCGGHDLRYRGLIKNALRKFVVKYL